MRVLMVNDQAPGPSGGVEMHLARLVRGLRAAGHEVATFAGVVAHRGPGRALDIWDPATRLALRSRAEGFGPDVVHIHNFQRELSASVLGAVAAPTVLTVHDHRLFEAREGAPGRRHGAADALKAAKNVLDRWAVRRHVDIAVAVSDELARRLEAAGIQRVRTVGNFADPPGDLGPPGDAVVFAGRLAPEKGLVALIEAFAAAAADRPRAQLVVAGEGPQRHGAELAARRLAPGRVRFTGGLDEAGVRDLLRCARVVCVPSVNPREGCPGIVIEAQLAARAVIASDAPAFRQIVCPGVDGLLVPAGDTAALARALARLLDDEEEARALGQAGRRSAQARATTAAGVEKLVAVYREAVGVGG